MNIEITQKYYTISLCYNKLGEFMDFKQHFIKSFGESRYESFKDGLNDKPRIGLIVNNLKTDITFIKSIFNDFLAHPIIDNALIYDSDIKLGKHPLFHAGAFYIQDPSAMLVSYILPINQNDKVIDLAAAPGGKSFQIATKLGEDGLLVANDLSYERAKTLSSNIEKYGFKNVYVTSNASQDFLINHQGYFDKVILDAPCSGEGMFRKDELAKNDWSVNKVEACARVQKQLIIDGYKLLKKGGIMVYSTCTFSPQENEDVIKYLLNNTKAKLIKIFDDPRFDRGLNLEETVRVFPDKFPGEGHFIALIEANDDVQCERKFNKQKEASKLDAKLLNDFLITNTNLKIDNKRLIENNGFLYLLPNSTINTNGLNVLRHGLLIGNVEKNIFFPHHSLAMSLTRDECKNVINLSLNSNNIASYLTGNAITAQGDGYYLVCVEGLSLGWGKVSNGIFKNHYPKGLRNK
jgi:NOL1/NOP2/sun family putative RNA methylase